MYRLTKFLISFILDFKISKKVSQTAAENVINIHKYKANDGLPKKNITNKDKSLARNETDQG